MHVRIALRLAYAAILLSIRLAVSQPPECRDGSRLATTSSRPASPSETLRSTPPEDASPAEHECALRRFNRGVIELDSLSAHDWAGRYLCSLNATLVLAPEAGLAVFGNGCLQHAYVINHGDVARFADGVLTLNLAINPADYPRPPDPRMVYAQQYISAEMIVVIWGDARFLVPAERMVQFCNDVNAGRNVADAYFFRVDPADPAPLATIARFQPPAAQPLPSVPEPWRKFLLPKPISATVIEAGAAEATSEERKNLVGPGVFRITLYRQTLVIDVGVEHELCPGLLFYPAQGDQRRVIEVVEVGPHRSSLLLRTSSQSVRDFRPVEIGDTLTTLPRTITSSDLADQLWWLYSQQESLDRVLERGRNRTDAQSYDG